MIRVRARACVHACARACIRACMCVRAYVRACVCVREASYLVTDFNIRSTTRGHLRNERR